MKKLTFLAATIAVSFATACMNENLENNGQKPEKSDNYVEFTASSALTRTSIAEDGKSVLWNKDDKISVFDATSSTGAIFTTDIQQNSASAVFKGKATPSASTYYAVYPAEDPADHTWKAPTWIEAGKVKINLEQSQRPLLNAFPTNVPNTSYASCQADNTTMIFHNCLAFVHIRIGAEAGAKSFTIVSGDKKQMSGDATLDLINNKVILSNQANKQSSMLMNEKMTPLLAKGEYYMAVLPGTHNSLNVIINPAEGKIIKKTIKGPVTFESGKIYDLGDVLPQIPSAEATNDQFHLVDWSK